MTNEQIFIQQIKKNLQKLTEVTSADLTLQVDKYRSAPLVDLKIYFELSESVIDWNLVEERLREQIAVKHEQGFGIIDDNQFYNTTWFSDYQTKYGLQYYWKRFLDKQTILLQILILKSKI